MKTLNSITKILMGLVFHHILFGKSSNEALKSPPNPLFLKDAIPETSKPHPSVLSESKFIPVIFFSRLFCLLVWVLVLRIGGFWKLVCPSVVFVFILAVPKVFWDLSSPTTD